MKIAIAGKGGVGKTTLSSILSHLYSLDGKKVIAVDADPDANLAAAFGLTDEETKAIKPVSEMKELIAERTGATPGSMGGVFKLNPKVDDIPESFSHEKNGVRLLVMGKHKEATSGCYCPENVFLKRLLRHIVLERDDVVIADMEAGIEHLTRGTSASVDAFIVVVEPGKRSLQTAVAVNDMAKGIGIDNVLVVANKTRGSEDIDIIKSTIGDMHFIGAIGFSNDVVEADLKGIPPFLKAEKTIDEVKVIKGEIEKIAAQSGTGR